MVTISSKSEQYKFSCQIKNNKVQKATSETFRYLNRLYSFVDIQQKKLREGMLTSTKEQRFENVNNHACQGIE